MLAKQELKIISYLRRNARKPLTEISREIGMPVSTIFSKIKKIEDEYVIKHTSLIDFKAVNHGIRVNFAVKTKDKKKLLAFLDKNPNVNSIFRIKNDFDFFIDAVFRNMKELADFTSTLQEFDIENLKEHHIIEDLKREEFLAI